MHLLYLHLGRPTRSTQTLPSSGLRVAPHKLRGARITFSTSTPSCATVLLGLPWDEPPSLERVADTGKILPVDAGTCLDMEHCKFGAGHQCDLRACIKATSLA
jgi:hypothetical protein